MNVHYTNLVVEAANGISPPSRSIGTKKAFEDSRGSATMIAVQGEAACVCAGSDNAAALGAADWISLAAAPTFAIMALFSDILSGGPMDMLCSVERGASPLSGMVLMYLLMSAFHTAPWLKLISKWRIDAGRS